MSLATLGCIMAQERSGRQKTDGRLDFTFAPLGVQEQKTQPGKLDFTFPSIRPLLQQPNSHQNTEPGKLDFTLRPQRSPTPQERLFRPNRKIRLIQSPSPCAIPLLEKPIPRNNDYTLRQSHPNTDKLVPMPNVKVPAPSCADKK